MTPYPAPDAEVYTSDGEPVRFSELWAEGPIAIVFLRHFG